MKQKNIELERNQLVITPLVFMESYNKGAPAGFPRVSIELLKQFQAAFPSLFKQSDAWSIDKHRKRLMDWLPSQHVVS